METEPESLDGLVAQVCHLHHMRVHQLLEEIGLYRGQPPVLFALWEREGQTQSELAARLGNTPATVTRTLQRMEKAGFIARRPDPKDQRVTRVYVTEAGWAVETRLKAIKERMEQEVFGGFTPPESQAFRACLRQTALRLRALTGEISPTQQDK